MRRRLVAGLAGTTIVLAACGGGGAADAPIAEDGSVVTLPAPAEGPPPDLPVSPESVDSPFPNLAVRQINGDGGWIQFKDLLPADKPVLVWFYAPH